MATFHPAQPGSLGVTAGLSPQHIQPALLPTPWTLCGARPTPAAQAGQGETSQRLREGAELATDRGAGVRGAWGGPTALLQPVSSRRPPQDGLAPPGRSSGCTGVIFLP